MSAPKVLAESHRPFFNVLPCGQLPIKLKYHNHLPETLEKSESMKSHPHPSSKQSFMNLHLPSMQLKNFNALSLILAFLMCTGFTFANGYHAASPKPAAAQLQYILDHACCGGRGVDD